MKKVNRDFMYNRCREYKVRIRKNDDLPTLCLKYLNKKHKMQPWDYPVDGKGNATWLNPIINLEDEIAKLIIYEKISSINKESISDESILLLKEKIKNTLKEYLDNLKEYETIKKIRSSTIVSLKGPKKGKSQSKVSISKTNRS